MFIIGSDKLFNEKIYTCNNKKDILKNTNKNILIKDIKLAKFCYDEKIDYFAIIDDEIIDMMYFFNLKPKCLISKDLNFAKEMQSLANEYLMDSKIALIIQKDKDILKAISQKIDGVIFNSCII